MQVLLIYYKVEEQYSGLLKLYASYTNIFKVEEQYSGLLKLYPGWTNILQGRRTVFWFTEAVSRFY